MGNPRDLWEARGRLSMGSLNPGASVGDGDSASRVMAGDSATAEGPGKSLGQYKLVTSECGLDTILPTRRRGG